MSRIDDDERKTRELLEGIRRLSPHAEQLTEGEEEFLLGVLRGELNDVPDRFTGNAIVNVSPNTPEQQRAIDEINAELEAGAKLHGETGDAAARGVVPGPEGV